MMRLCIVSMILLTFCESNCVIWNFDEINELIDNVCVPNRFNDMAKCGGVSIMEGFEKQTFDFRRIDDIETYGAWLRLLNNLQYFRPSNARRMLKLIADKNCEWTMANGGRGKSAITADMQMKASEVFRWTADTWMRFHVKNDYDAFEETLASFVNFFNTVPIWAGADFVYFFKVIMSAYEHVRKTYLLHTMHIDRIAKETIEMILEYPLMTSSPDEVKRLFYMYYVSKLPKLADYIFFKGLYITVEKRLIMPYNNSFTVGKFNYIVFHNVLDEKKINAMRVETDYVYETVTKFFEHTNVVYNYNTTDVDVFVHENKRMYELTGPMWSIQTNNGGYTHISHDNGRIESHVYYEGDLLPRNYGHELVHTLMYVLKAVRRSPLWFSEGIANRLGNRACYGYDHDSLKRYRNATIEQIIQSHYGDYLLYGMGSALVAFWYETRPVHLGEMIRRHNFTFAVDAQMRNDFTIFKTNKLIECDSAANKKIVVVNMVQEQYRKAIQNVDFGACKNYIKFMFNDVIFYMTPTRLIKANIDKNSPIVDQKEIKFNTERISQFDYDWFLKGVLKQTLISFGDTTNVLKIDSTYSYESRISCQDGGADPTNAIIQFGHQSGIWNTVAFMERKSIDEGRMFVGKYMRNIKMCDTFINPPIDNRNISRRLTNLARRIDKLKMIRIEENEKTIRVDARGNTIFHLMALHNHRLYRVNEQGNNIYIKRLVNYDGMSPQDLYEYSSAFRQKFGRAHNKYCWSIPTIKHRTVDEAITIPLLVSTSLSTTPLYQTFYPVTTLKNIDIAIVNETQLHNVQVNSISSNNITSNNTNYNINTNNVNIDKTTKDVKDWDMVNKKILIFSLIFIFIVTLIILVNIFITIIVIKYKLTKIKERSKNNTTHVSFNKNKFYNDDECSIKLFV
ncbi:ORF-121 [Buzura suppressaria nucleopolyhedrovirus]|uniref:ORF-121 n=1 Tax=Buzura suppressaria nuclear polyhedrosis virus TaxID=74320 RepID=W5VKM2_NPVBS|nr:ORF-121 [Buzura suppressaria nucleopolyhedrovirus]AHH82710.1 ORF-121 [Buzura suppressaria nucleopolyhedrovirus]